MKEKKSIIIAVVNLLLLLVGAVGASYAYFATANKTTGNDKNLNIVTENLGDIKWEGTKVYTSGDLLPGECGIQTFTIEKNSTSGKGIYEIDLKGILDESFGSDVEITLYKSTDTTTNNVTIKEGNSTISGDTTKQYYKEDSVVLNGTPEKVYGTKALQNKNQIILQQADFDNSTLEKTTYYLVYCYKNNGNQDSQQGKSFSGEISVRLILEKGSQEETATNAAEYITTLAQTDTTNLVSDEAGNVRYIGSNPNNYIAVEDEKYNSDVYIGYYTLDDYRFYTNYDFCLNDTKNFDNNGNENCMKVYSKDDKILWRIIGVMKNIDDGTGNKSDRVKLIRSESIGQYSWDTSESSVNDGDGVNEWSQADLMKLLNPGYESESVGGSLYWNGGSGTCYYGANNATESCNFTSTGIKDKLKTLIGDAVWNTGSNETNIDTNATFPNFYNLERSNNTGKICSSGNYCNDTVSRTTTWTGKVGLMYPSDYGYATSGSSTINRATCLNAPLSDWNSTTYLDCLKNNWFISLGKIGLFGKWSLMPYASSSKASTVISVGQLDTDIENYRSHYTYAVLPSAYLKTSVKISSGTGSESDPFTLSY